MTWCCHQPLHRRRACQTPLFERQLRTARHTGVVELVVGEQRAVVALGAVRLADEEPQSGDLVRGQDAGGGPARSEGIDMKTVTRDKYEIAA